MKRQDNPSRPRNMVAVRTHEGRAVDVLRRKPLAAMVAAVVTLGALPGVGQADMVEPVRYFYEASGEVLSGVTGQTGPIATLNVAADTPDKTCAMIAKIIKNAEPEDEWCGNTGTGMAGFAGFKAVQKTASDGSKSWSCDFTGHYDDGSAPNNVTTCGATKELSVGMTQKSYCRPKGFWPTPDAQRCTASSGTPFLGKNLDGRVASCGSEQWLRSDGDPIDSYTGDMFLTEMDYQGGDGLEFYRTYHSSADTETTGDLGGHWRHNYDRRVTTTIDPYLGPVANSYASFTNAEGKRVGFTYTRQTDGTYKWVPDADVKDTLTVYMKEVDPMISFYGTLSGSSGSSATTGGGVLRADSKPATTGKKYQITAWHLLSPSGEKQVFNGDGRLYQVVDRGGITLLTLAWTTISHKNDVRSYLNGGWAMPTKPDEYRLDSVTDRNGRVLTLDYQGGEQIVNVLVTVPGQAPKVAVVRYDFDFYEPAAIPPYGDAWGSASALDGPNLRFPTTDVSVQNVKGFVSGTPYATGDGGGVLLAEGPKQIKFPRLIKATYPEVGLIDGARQGVREYRYSESGLFDIAPSPVVAPAAYTFDVSAGAPDFDYSIVVNGTINLVQPFAITGVIDNGKRTATWKYDKKGRAFYNERIAGTNRVRVDYNVTKGSEVGSLVTEWLGDGSSTRQSFRTFDIKQGVALVKSQSQPAGSGCGAKTSFASYNEDGTVATSKDFNGATTTYVPYGDAIPGMVGDVKVQGEDNIVKAHTNVATADPVLKLPKLIKEYLKPDVPGNTDSRNTALEYYPAGDARYGLLKSKTVQAPGTPARTWSYDYYVAADGNKKMGKLRSVIEPLRAGALTTTRFDYDANGNLATVTAPDNSVTTYELYNNIWGLPEKITASDGITTQLQYNARGWLTKQVVGGKGCVLATVVPAATDGCLVTNYDYDNDGRVMRVTQPDGATLKYGYVNGLLEKVTDSQGNYTKYTSDKVGNITKVELIKSDGRTLLQEHEFVYDPLGRIMLDKGSAN